MRLISYRAGRETGVGVMRDEASFVALPKAAPELPRSLRKLLCLGAPALQQAAASTRGKSADYRLADVTLDPVVPDPQAIWCVGLNYMAHREETGSKATDEPILFLRTPLSQVGHLQPMLKPKASDRFDFEGELAVIIGTGGRHIPQERAFDAIAGYSCYNEGTVRDWQRHTPQYGPGKNFFASGAFGPWMVTPDEFGNPDRHTVVTRLNGVEMQRAGIEQMIFKIPKLINYLSTVYPLQPGDVIATGTPSGVGNRRTPPIYMRPGDTITVEISGIGTLINPIAAEL